MPNAKVIIDLSKIAEKEFDPSRPLRVASVRGGVVVDQKIVTPAKESNARNFAVQLSLGPGEDGVSGAEIVVAPADDERNLKSKLTARKFVSSAAEKIDAGVLQVSASIYSWWRFCWFPRQYHVTGRLVRQVDNCTHPIGGAQVEIFDVDYCWWWYGENLLTTGNTDANGFFDITFTWCVPLWCLFEIAVRQPIIIDPLLRDRVHEVLKERTPVKFPPPPPPPDPWEWERQLTHLGIESPSASRLQPAASLSPRVRQIAASAVGETAFQRTAAVQARPLATTKAVVSRADVLRTPAIRAIDRTPAIRAIDLFSDIIFWPPCDDPCDWLPDIKIRVRQNQPGGTVVIYEDTYWQIHFNQATDLLNLTLQANSSAFYADDCGHHPLLGNCMLLDAVGAVPIMPNVSDPLSGIYQPDVYGATPDRKTRLGYVKNYDRPWAGSLKVHGRFGIAAGVDYYQVQVAKWTSADLDNWDADHTYVPPDGAFAPVPVSALESFVRLYNEESPLPLHWNSETFGPQTVSGIPALYKSRERFEQEYRDTHGGSNPAPDFGGWYWYYFTETSLFHLDTSKMANGLYTFRFVCYRQTGVDGMGNPILALVNMGLPNGVGKRCTTAKPELVTLYLFDTPHNAACNILNFRKNGVDVIDECAMVTLTHTDWIDVEYQASDSAGNLDSYEVTLQKGFSAEHDILGLAGVTAVSGSSPEGPTYGAALADLGAPAIPPYWYGGSWRKKVPYSTFVAMGGSCAYNLRVRAWDRHTDGLGGVYTGCEKDRAFTVILA